MTRIEREQMIERYVQGMMPSSEEEGFLIEVASDPELRYELKASQVIDSAIRKDRSRGVISTGKMRANIALLAAPLDLASTDLRDSATPGSWFSRWTAGPGGFVTLVIVSSLFISGDPLQNRSDLPTPVDQVISIQQEDLSPISEVTDIAEQIPADMVSVEPQNSPRGNAEPQRGVDRTVRTQTAAGPSVRKQSTPIEKPHSSGVSAAPPPSQPPAAPVTPPVALDTATSNIIDQGVDASDTTNSGLPSMDVDIDSMNPPN